MNTGVASAAWPALLVTAGIAYLLALFVFAHWADGPRGRAHVRRWRLPAYTLALAVYCSSWTFFGAVGSAAREGWSFLPIYLGPIVVFLFGIGYLRRLVEAAHSEGSTSIADFIGARFSRSRTVAALVTLIALVGTIPYLALQLRSIGTGFTLMTGGSNPVWPMAISALLLGGFAILFGTRRFETATRNDGMLAAIAGESVVKILAFSAIGLFALLAFMAAPDAAQTTGIAGLTRSFALNALNADFLVTTFLAAAAILCLPRQFHIGVVEASAPSDPVRARWPFIAYLAITALLVLPITLEAMTLPELARSPDMVVLALPLREGHAALALLVFIGGLAAATGMVIVESIALSTMVSNDLIAPWLVTNSRGTAPGRTGARLLFARRAVIVMTMAAALTYAIVAPTGTALASMGLVAFAAMAQFLPALVLAVRRGGRDPIAASAGLATGFLLWGGLLLYPAISATTVLPDTWVIPGLSGFSQSALVSLAGNIAVHALVALRTARGTMTRQRSSGPHPNGSVSTPAELATFVARFVGAERSAALLTDEPTPATITPALARRSERMIAEVIGAPSARALISAVLSGTRLTAQDVARLLDETGQSLQFSKGLLAATLEHIDPGVSVVDRDLKLVAWNSRYLELFAYPPAMVDIGTPVATLIRYNALRGECGPGEVEAHVAKRLDHMRRGLSHSFERTRPDGRVLKTVGGPMPGGGYVMCFTDITSEAEARVALERERVLLEQRVTERTDALSTANAALERATHDKTRFLAAASHDVMQPLHATRLFLSALENEVSPRGRDLLDKALQSVKGGEDLLRSLLDISRIDAGGVEARQIMFAVRPLLVELASAIGQQACKKGLSIRVGPGDAWVESDPSLVRSIVQNLLTNAVRYTRSGGVIVGVRRRGTMAHVEVWDTGPGIAPDQQALIFQEFERLDHGTETGAGLGLAIVERTARLIGARIMLDSIVGRGSRFALQLPLAAAPIAEPANDAAATNDQRSVGRLSLLVVDDDATVRAASAAALQAWGHDVSTAAAAQDALDMTGRFDAALVDHDLGVGMDGLTLATRLRASGKVRRVAIISANMSADLEARAAAARLPSFAKPVDPRRLAAWLDDSAAVWRTPVSLNRAPIQ